MERKASTQQRKSRKTDKDIQGAYSEIIASSSVRKSNKHKTKKSKSVPAEALLASFLNDVDEEKDNKSEKSQNDDLQPNATIDEGANDYIDFVTKFTELLAEDFWETAWDICETRFLHKNASLVVSSELRDSWLSIVEMQWMDSEPDLFEKVKFPVYEDMLPLPPKFDLWSHGALEPLPRTLRESVMDPFLRNPLPWVLEKYEDEQKKVTTSISSPLTVSNSEEFMDILQPNQNLVRPKSPVPASDEADGITESLWSVASTHGSFDDSPQLDVDDDKDNELGHLIASKSSASLAFLTMQETAKSAKKAHSIELIYPSKIPKAVIKASSDLLFKNGSGLPGYAKRGGGRDGVKSQSEIVAFKLPRQTSSESRNLHYERKSRMKPVHSSSSSHQ